MILPVLAVYWGPILLWILLVLPSISGSNIIDTACTSSISGGCTLDADSTPSTSGLNTLDTACTWNYFVVRYSGILSVLEVFKYRLYCSYF